MTPSPGPVPDGHPVVTALWTVHFLWWGFLVGLGWVIIFEGEPLALIQVSWLVDVAPIQLALCVLMTLALSVAFVVQGRWVTRFVFTAGLFYIWRGSAVLYSDDPYRAVRVVEHVGHILSLMVTHTTWGILRFNRGEPLTAG